MPKYLHIEIPDPCNQKWDNMSQQEHGKYCNSCKKTVTDFTLFSNPQLVHFLKNNKENVCGRFYNDQLNTALLIPKKEIPWLRYFFTITIPAFLFSMKATAQKELKFEQNSFLKKKNKLKILKQKQFDVSLLKPIFTTEKNFLDTTEYKTLQEIVVRSDNINHYQRTTMGAFLSGVTIEMVTSKKEIINSEKNSSLNIFPNPIAANSILNISWIKEITGDQLVEIFNANGQLIQREKINIAFKTNTSSITLNNLRKGFYIICVSNRKTGQKLSKEFIVQ